MVFKITFIETYGVVKTVIEYFRINYNLQETYYSNGFSYKFFESLSEELDEIEIRELILFIDSIYLDTDNNNAIIVPMKGLKSSKMLVFIGNMFYLDDRYKSRSEKHVKKLFDKIHKNPDKYFKILEVNHNVDVREHPEVSEVIMKRKTIYEGIKNKKKTKKIIEIPHTRTKKIKPLKERAFISVRHEIRKMINIMFTELRWYEEDTFSELS